MVTSENVLFEAQFKHFLFHGKIRVQKLRDRVHFLTHWTIFFSRGEMFLGNILHSLENWVLNPGQFQLTTYRAQLIENQSYGFVVVYSFEGVH